MRVCVGPSSSSCCERAHSSSCTVVVGNELVLQNMLRTARNFGACLAASRSLCNREQDHYFERVLHGFQQSIEATGCGNAAGKEPVQPKAGLTALSLSPAGIRATARVSVVAVILDPSQNSSVVQVRTWCSVSAFSKKALCVWVLRFGGTLA